MRTVEQNKAYMQKRRYFERLRYVKIKEKCRYCGKDADTLHHINENQDDNRRANLLPVCHECHLNISHTCDKPNYYSVADEDLPIMPKKRAKNAISSPNKPVTLQKTMEDMLSSCNTSRFYGITLLNPTNSNKINIIEGSKRLLIFLKEIGYSILC